MQGFIFSFSSWINAWWWILLNIIICNRIKSSRKFHTFPFKCCNCFLFSSFFCLTLYLTSEMKQNRDLPNTSCWELEQKTEQSARHKSEKFDSGCTCTSIQLYQGEFLVRNTACVMSSANEDKCDCDDSFWEMMASHLLVWRTLSRNGVNLCRVVQRTGCQKGGHFYYPKLKAESRRTKDIDSSIYLDVDMFFTYFCTWDRHVMPLFGE